MNIKEKIFAYYRRQQPERQAIFPKYDDVRSILILFESDMDEQNGTVKAIRNELLTQDKDVVLWGYCNKKEITSHPLPQYRIVGRKDFNLFGAPKEEVIKELQRRPYNLLIDLSQRPVLPMHYLAMYARADFKAGLSVHGTGLHDLLISTPAQENPHFLYTQIVKYLKMIQTK